LAAGLAGKGSHVAPARAVSGLAVDEAAAVPPGGLHSAHRLLQHIVLWQDLMLLVMEGGTVSWPNEAGDWSAPLRAWSELTQELSKGLSRAHQLAANGDLSASLPKCWPGLTLGDAVMVLITHNSYHLGQLVDARRATGHWPPPGKG